MCVLMNMHSSWLRGVFTQFNLRAWGP